MKFDYVIGIDPDSEKSGVAAVNTKTKEVMLESLPFADIATYFMALRKLKTNALVVVEAGWLNQANWHINGNQTASVIAKIGEHVGACHQTGKLICEMAKKEGLEVQTVRPLAKCWKGHNKKITHKEIKEIINTNIKARTNQEERDALLLAWTYAQLPFRNYAPNKNYNKL